MTAGLRAAEAMRTTMEKAVKASADYKDNLVAAQKAAEKAAPRTKKPERPQRTPAESAGRKSSSTKTRATKITRVRNCRLR